MKTYRLEVKVTGWITREIEARTKEEATEIASEVDWSMPLGDLQWKSTEVELNWGQEE